MLKIIIILILIGYVFYRVTSLIFSGLFGGFNRQQHFGQSQSQYTRKSRKAPDSNLNIDNVPGNRSKKDGDYRGGEYVDFEEVK
ncbi:DUF4834 family protein [Ekhidna sp.]|uniref:DUF4834 family protein n=1 Tax=Ekhidna sp. TaxID=2608089 RepID=UPI003B5A38EB